MTTNPYRSIAIHYLRWLALLAVSLSPTLFATTLATADDQRPNVVFIIVDDLNDLPLAPLGKPAIATPNIDRLAERGVSFTNAHTNDPICAPSRACMMFGLYPQTTGLYWFENWRQNKILNESVSLNRHLKNNGYGVFGTGKVYHIGRGDNAFDEFGYRTEFGPWPWDGKSGQVFTPHPAMMYMYETDGDIDYKWEHHFGRLSMIPEWPANVANGTPGYKGWRLYGKRYRYVNSEDRDPLADELCADWGTEIIERAHEKPYALFVGLTRTHTPLYAPDEYFDRFPLDSIELPETTENDLEDCADVLADRSLYGFRRYHMLVRHKDRQLYKQWLQAYLACTSFVDDQVGKVLDAVDKSPQRENTIVVFTSDHGFHMGEKEFLYKQSLWDGATRVPLIVAGLEGMPEGTTCHQPVSLIDIYPTVNDLCGLPTEPNANGNGYQLEGHSLRPLLTNPDGEWTGPNVAITALPGKDHSQHNQHTGTWYPHFSVRSEQFRYTLCTSGEEELYDYATDPLEWKNLAGDPAYADTKASLKQQLIALRDGRGWKSLDALDPWMCGPGTRAQIVDEELHATGDPSFHLAIVGTYRDFELQWELKSRDMGRLRVSYGAASEDNGASNGVSAIRLSPPDVEGDAVRFQSGDWNRYRFRVLGDRCRVWINGQVYSDVRNETLRGVFPISIDATDAAGVSLRIRNARVRSLRQRPVVGAIRWDAWTGGRITEQVERTLGPRKYHDRLPWFARVLDDTTVKIDGSRQDVMDREIDLAASAGLDYWAFLIYPRGNTMSVALEQYLTSPMRGRIRFCQILHNTLNVPDEQWPAERQRAVEMLETPGYQTVLGNRPLVYAFQGGQFPFDRFSDFLSAARKKGLDPYCVYMGWDPASDYQKVRQSGFHAVSAYAKSSSQARYSSLAKTVEADYWVAAARAGVPYIPLVTTGWDKTPRKDNPVTWEQGHGYHRQTVFPSRAKPLEIAEHLRNGIAFVREHPETCEANAVIIYAWNEYDEGGWLAPTRNADGTPDTSRLDAIRDVLYY